MHLLRLVGELRLSASRGCVLQRVLDRLLIVLVSPSQVRTWFNQPGRKKRRRLNRLRKAVADAPKPVAGLLRPIVRSQTAKYNNKQRYGRGFTTAELKVRVWRVNMCVGHLSNESNARSLLVRVELP